MFCFRSHLFPCWFFSSSLGYFVASIHTRTGNSLLSLVCLMVLCTHSLNSKVICLGCLQTAEPELSGKLSGKNIHGMLFNNGATYKGRSYCQTKPSTPMHMRPPELALPVQYSPVSRFALWLVGLGGGRGGCLAGAFPFFLAWGASLLLWLVVAEAAIAFFGGSGAFLDLGLGLGSGGARDAGISGQWSVVLSMDKKVNRSQHI